MEDSTHYERIAWEDRFNRPGADALRADLDESSARLYDRTRTQISQIEGLQEQTAWHGQCWRWSVEYRSKLSSDPIAVVIPSPADLQIAVPMDRKFVESLSIQQMKRTIRDGLEMVTEPFDSRWGVWSIQSAGIIDDLVDLIESKLGHLARVAG